MSRSLQSLCSYSLRQHTATKGIGLFITRTQIEAMGGSIHAESEVDRGTKFKVILVREQ